MEAIRILEDFGNFNDGLLESFEYFYRPNSPLAARIVLSGRNFSTPTSEWRTIELLITDVQELHARRSGRQFNSISSGVKLLKFDGLWCVDVDGTYAFAEDPASLNDVRQHGECYVVGKAVVAREISP
jgi:hypothetical protein